jgi:hypothetical protein
VPIARYPRFDNPWADTRFGAQVVDIREGSWSVRLDFGAGRRRVQGAP